MPPQQRRVRDQMGPQPSLAAEALREEAVTRTGFDEAMGPIYKGQW